MWKELSAKCRLEEGGTMFIITLVIIYKWVVKCMLSVFLSFKLLQVQQFVEFGYCLGLISEARLSHFLIVYSKGIITFPSEHIPNFRCMIPLSHLSWHSHLLNVNL